MTQDISLAQTVVEAALAAAEDLGVAMDVAVADMAGIVLAGDERGGSPHDACASELRTPTT